MILRPGFQRNNSVHANASGMGVSRLLEHRSNLQACEHVLHMARVHFFSRAIAHVQCWMAVAA